MIFTFSSLELSWPIVVVFHVGHSTSKVNIPAIMASLDWVSLNVGWIGNDLSWVLFTSEVLLNVSIVRFMLIGCMIVSLLDFALKLEPFFVTGSDLNISILDPGNRADGWLVQIAAAIVTRFSKQHFIDTRSFLDGVSSNIRRVDLDLLHVSIGDKSRYKQQVMSLVNRKNLPTYPFSANTCYCHQWKEVGMP